MPPDPKGAKKKIVMLGDGSVGKTSLIRRYVLDTYNDEYISTIGTKVTTKEMTMGKSVVKLMIWDVLGQRGFTTVQTTAIYGAHGAILVVDLTKKETLESLEEYWVPLLKKVTGEIPFVIFGNKADLKDQLELGMTQFSDLVKNHNSSYYSTSAKTGLNVGIGFSKLAEAVMPVRLMKGRRTDTPPEAQPEITTLVQAADFLMSDFCRKYGNPDHAMNIIRQQFNNADLDVRSLDAEGLRKLVNSIEKIDKGNQGEEAARMNKQHRLRMLRKVLQTGGGDEIKRAERA